MMVMISKVITMNKGTGKDKIRKTKEMQNKN